MSDLLNLADRVEGAQMDRLILARLIALHGLGTSDGSHRSCPPNERWEQEDWEARVLDCIPALAEVRCLKLADEILALTAASLRAIHARGCADGEEGNG